MNDLFFVLGIALTVMAVVVAFVGLRVESFPASRPVMVGVLGLMAFLVVGTAAFAISLAREEHEVREAEIFEYRAEQAKHVEEGDEPIAAEPSDEAPVQGGELALTSPEAGDLLFEPDALDAKAGEVVLTYTNPSEVPHNVAIEGGGEELAQSETVTGGDSADATAELEPGEYTYFCSIPGHRESGMEGTLTVK
jgi:plastocyanin